MPHNLHQNDIEFLYKYYPEYRAFDNTGKSYIQKIFTHNEIHFQCPLNFNDPFDCKYYKISFAASRNERKKYLFKRSKKYLSHLNRNQRQQWVEDKADNLNAPELSALLENNIDNLLKSIGILCCSERNNNKQMWINYSSSHKGFCLEFEATSRTPFFGEAQPIKYSNEMPTVNIIRDTDEEKLDKSILRKKSSFDFEEEWRIIKREGAGVYIFPEHLLTSVIFGLETSEQDKQALIKLSKSRKYPPRVYCVIADNFHLNLLPNDNSF